MFIINAMSKAAILMLTKVLALELASDNIQVNAIAPGFVKTRFSVPLWQNLQIYDAILKSLPQKRMAEPQEIADLNLYLVSSAPNFLTGATPSILAPGNWLVHPLSDNRRQFPMNKLTRQQWEELDVQMSRTSPIPEADDLPGEHFHLIALLNQLGLNPISKAEALRIAEELLTAGWEESK